MRDRYYPKPPYYFFMVVYYVLCLCSCGEKKKTREMHSWEYMPQFVNEKVVINNDTFVVVNFDTNYETFDLYRDGKTITVDINIVDSQVKKPKTIKVRD
jgi:hypothetical protein